MQTWLAIVLLSSCLLRSCAAEAEPSAGDQTLLEPIIELPTYRAEETIEANAVASLRVGETFKIQFFCCADLNCTMRIASDNAHIARLSLEESSEFVPGKIRKHSQIHEQEKEAGAEEDSGQVLSVKCEQQRSEVFLMANHVGRFELTISEMRVFVHQTPFDIDDTSVSRERFTDTGAITEVEQRRFVFNMEIIRRWRIVDSAFELAVCVVIMINMLGLGCYTSFTRLKEKLKDYKPVLIGVIGQIIVVPLASFAVAKAWPLSSEYSLGLLFVACIPGSGLALILVNIMRADEDLSMVISFIDVFLPLVNVPVWLLLLGSSQFPFKGGEHRLSSFFDRIELWLTVFVLPYLFGLFLNGCLPRVAEALLTWLVKPMLLLTFILFITLGVYINIYVFDPINPACAASAFLVPMIGLLYGAASAYILRLPFSTLQTLATECAVSNCLLSLFVMRKSLVQPEADLTSTMSFWVLFMTLLPFIAAKVALLFRNLVRNFCQKLKEQQYEHMTLVAGIAAVNQLVTLQDRMLEATFPDRDKAKLSLSGESNGPLSSKDASQTSAGRDLSDASASDVAGEREHLLREKPFRQSLPFKSPPQLSDIADEIETDQSHAASSTLPNSCASFGELQYNIQKVTVL